MTAPPCVAIRSETLAVSMLDPPPIPTKPSKPPSAANAAASSNEAAVGSTRAESHSSVSIPDASIVLAHALGDAGRDHSRVADQHRPLHAEALQLPAGVGGCAAAELERGRLEREDLLVAHRMPAVSRSRKRSRSNRRSRTSSRSCSSSSSMSFLYVSRANSVATTEIRPSPVM